MDLGTVSRRLQKGKYAHPDHLLADVQLVSCRALFCSGGGCVGSAVTATVPELQFMPQLCSCKLGWGSCRAATHRLRAPRHCCHPSPTNSHALAAWAAAPAATPASPSSAWLQLPALAPWCRSGPTAATSMMRRRPSLRPATPQRQPSTSCGRRQGSMGARQSRVVRQAAARRRQQGSGSGLSTAHRLTGRRRHGRCAGQGLGRQRRTACSAAHTTQDMLGGLFCSNLVVQPF